MQEQTPKGDLLEFHQEFSTFNLSARLCDDKLTIKIYDFVDWIVYEKQYSQSDVGVDIHKKVDLEDIYFSLAQNKSKEGNQNSDFAFGEVIINGQRLCFKIEKGGKMTTYTPGIESKTGKQIYHESMLTLSKSRAMSQMQILSQKVISQKRQHTKKFEQRLEQLKEQNIRQALNYKKLQQQNKELQSQLQNTKKQMTILKQQQIKTNQQIKRTYVQMEKNSEDLQNKMKQLLAESNKSKDVLVKQINKYRDGSNGKIDGLQNKLKKQVEDALSRFLLFNLVQPYQNKFKVYLNYQVEYSGDNGSFTHFIFNQKISFNTPFTFKIKIVKTASRYIMIGVLDYLKQKDQRTSYSSGNAVCYYGCNAYKYGQNASQGAGFSQGETVEVSVNLAAKNIKWSVGGAQRATSTLDMLGDQSRVFMPFVEMYNTVDIVQWIFD